MVKISGLSQANQEENLDLRSLLALAVGFLVLFHFGWEMNGKSKVHIWREFKGKRGLEDFNSEFGLSSEREEEKYCSSIFPFDLHMSICMRILHALWVGDSV